MSDLPLEAIQYDLPDDIVDLMRANDFAALGQKIQDLLDLPQSLCKQRGACCQVVMFKGSLTYDELLAVAEDKDSTHGSTAREFLTLFTPFESEREASMVAPGFIQRTKEARPDKEEITYFRCRFVGENGKCQIHEDRPTGCRMYPFPHDRTVYHPGCGYEEAGTRNLRYMTGIQAFFERRLAEIDAASTVLLAQESSGASPA